MAAYPTLLGVHSQPVYYQVLLMRTSGWNSTATISSAGTSLRSLVRIANQRQTCGRISPNILIVTNTSCSMCLWTEYTRVLPTYAIIARVPCLDGVGEYVGTLDYHSVIIVEYWTGAVSYQFWRSKICHRDTLQGWCWPVSFTGAPASVSDALRTRLSKILLGVDRMDCSWSFIGTVLWATSAYSLRHWWQESNREL